jgi:hypothetical protein
MIVSRRSPKEFLLIFPFLVFTLSSWYLTFGSARSEDVAVNRALISNLSSSTETDFSSPPKRLKGSFHRRPRQ